MNYRNLFILTVCTAPSGLRAVEPFELIIIPDSQRYAQVINHGGPDLFKLQTSWIRDNVSAENIAFVTHVGDVIQDNASLWTYADEAMSPLDGAVPYGVTFGNHDGSAPGTFGSSRFQGYSWYLGSSSDQLAHAQTFSKAGIDFLHINLPHNPSTTHLDWAQGIITTHSGKPTIISTHGYMADNSSGRSSLGTKIWNALIEPNEQVFMTCNGHDWVSRHEVDSTTSERKVLQIQSNWQQIINGGNSLLQKVIFDPDNNEIRVKTYSPFLDLHHTDYSGEFRFAATFGTGSVSIGNELGPDIKEWNGGGADNNWQTSANWGGNAPVAGDILRFYGTTRKVSTNDYPAGTNFAGIVFRPGTYSNGYTFSGNSISLTGDIVNMGTYGPNTPRSGPRITFPIELTGDRQINTGDWDIMIDGVISGSGSLTKTHGRDYFRGSYDGGVYIGDLYLSQVNTYTGNTRISGGALILENTSSNNLVPNSPEIMVDFNAVLRVVDLQNGTLELASGQKLRGIGKISGKTTTSAGASISPGNSDTGKLILLDNLSMASGSNLDIRIGGSVSSTYDQIAITGSAEINNATLNLAGTGSYTPSVGDEIILLENDSTDAVAGNFISGTGSDRPLGTALGEGEIVSENFLNSGFSASISYTGGDGNDISIKILPAPGAPVFNQHTFSSSSAQTGSTYSASIAGSAFDGDGDTLIYTILSGPSWLKLNPGGSLSGTPSNSNLGTNQWSIQVNDGNGGTDTATLEIEVVPQKLIGLWEFDDSQDLTKATIGQNLVLTGFQDPTSGRITGDGAVRIGLGSHHAIQHGMTSNGGGNNVNEYTLVLDIKYPSNSQGKWISLFQTDASNGSDGDCFIRNSNASIGVSATGYSSWALSPETWVRLAVSVDNGNFYRLYANGSLILEGTPQSIDGRLSLGSTLLLFADNNGEDNPIDVSTIRLYNTALSTTEVTALGNAFSSDSDGDGITDDIDTDDDNDGMPDSWEATHSLPTTTHNGNEDEDGDGYSNLSEYISGTDPRQADSHPAILIEPSLTNSDMELKFSSVADRYYTVEYNDSLNPNNWLPLSPIFAGTGHDIIVSASSSAAKRFYRLKVELP